MKEQKPFWTAGLALLLIAFTFFTVNQWNQKQEKALADENKHLQNKNEEMEKEIDRLTSTNEYLKEKRLKEVEKNGFHTWPVVEKKANRLVEESNGKFKKSWAMYLVREADQYEINPYLVYELLKVETGGTFDPDLVGPETKYGRAYGMAQFMKNTAPWIADMADLPYEDELLFDPYYSMQLSLVYLDFLKHEYKNWDEALTAYHRGMGGLKEYKKENGHAESWYAVEIQENAENHKTVAVAN
ncbi:Transglycosylase SLT domain-containing protein [Halobacillus dabanensis]|uniref:Transglycosylase SLT domain-containing protein n=1 Tax=Halobacillus dabanensis TaxID=240302 RepID=A0A1I3PFL9_HALDA|nr:transglycosylase SLT domain-containing protein [Halobacillus dabanensis]SFJ20302.1 Transglycosylase SLT domain-containing protein [Halobacillus dabanensis]